MHQKYEELLKLCGITSDNTLEGTVAATQRAWLLPRVSEEPPEGTTYPLENSKRIRELLAQLGYLDERPPTRSLYDAAVVFGGESQHIQNRIEYLTKLLKKGLRISELFFHCGLHVQPDYDPAWDWLVVPPLESAVTRFLYESSGLVAYGKDIPVHFIDIPLHADGTRPTTGDGIKKWLETAPRPGSYLFISSQPYVLYQQAVISTYLPASFECETVGAAEAQSEPISEILDYVARHLYQELQKRKHSTY